TKEEADKTREKIFRAALHTFSEKGFAAARMTDVAEAAGVTRGAIYWHFASKEALIKEIVSRLSSYYDELARMVATEGEPFLVSLRQVIVSLLRRFAEDEEWRAMQELFMRSVFRREWENGCRDMPAAVDPGSLEALERAMRKGAIYGDWTPRSARLCLASAISGAFLQILDRGEFITEEEIEHIADFVVRGFEPQGQQ
ncbi:MAG: TetR family transcriptional regulator, partial [Spirochaetaceae bacterium]